MLGLADRQQSHQEQQLWVQPGHQSSCSCLANAGVCFAMMPPAPSQSSAELKQAIYKSAKGTSNGLKATQVQKDSIARAVEDLIKLNPTKAPAKSPRNTGGQLHVCPVGAMPWGSCLNCVCSSCWGELACCLRLSVTLCQHVRTFLRVCKTLASRCARNDPACLNFCVGYVFSPAGRDPSLHYLCALQACGSWCTPPRQEALLES